MKGRKIRNLTKEDISIVDYKKMLIKNSSSSRLRRLTYQLTDKRRFRRAGESQAVQQNCNQGQDIGAQHDPASVHLTYCALLCQLYGRCTLHMFRFHHHRLDCLNALVHVFYTKIHRRIRNIGRTSIQTTGWHSVILFKLPQEVLVAQNEILRLVCENPRGSTTQRGLTARSASTNESTAEPFSRL